MLREAACLQLAERLFHSFAPQNEKHFLPFSVTFFGKLRSVDVLRSLYEGLTIVLDSMPFNSLKSFPPQFLNQLMAGGVETTVCHNSSSPVLQLLQTINLSSTSTAPR